MIRPLAGMSAAAPTKKLVFTGTVTSVYQIDPPMPDLRGWLVHVRIEEIKVGKYSRRKFDFWTHNPSFAIGQRYRIAATWIGEEYTVDETELLEDKGKAH